MQYKFQQLKKYILVSISRIHTFFTVTSETAFNACARNYATFTRLFKPWLIDNFNIIISATVRFVLVSRFVAFLADLLKYETDSQSILEHQVFQLLARSRSMLNHSQGQLQKHTKNTRFSPCWILIPKTQQMCDKIYESLIRGNNPYLRLMFTRIICKSTNIS